MFLYLFHIYLNLIYISIIQIIMIEMVNININKIIFLLNLLINNIFLYYEFQQQIYLNKQNNYLIFLNDKYIVNLNLKILQIIFFHFHFFL